MLKEIDFTCFAPRVIKELKDGRQVCVTRRMYNSIITIGRTNDLTGYDDHW